MLNVQGARHARPRRLPRRPDLRRHGGGRRGRRGCGPAWRPPRARRQDRPAGRPRRHLRVRHPDAELPGRRRHQRPPARRRARGRPGRAEHRPALHDRRLPGAGAAVRRRRDHRAGHEHRPDGPGHRGRRLPRLPRPAGGAAQAALAGRPGRRRRCPRLRAGCRALLHRAVRRRRAGRHPARHAGHRDGRLARADRRGRGPDHRPRGRQHRRGPPRPGARRPAGARAPHPRGPYDGRAPT